MCQARTFPRPGPIPMHPSGRNLRVLVIDDNPAIHVDVRKILCPHVGNAAASLAELEAGLRGTDAPAGEAP